MDEATRISGVRGQILAMHDLATPYETASAVCDRIAELFDQERLKEAA